MTKNEALRLALEALEDLGYHHHDCPQWPTFIEPAEHPKCTCGYDQAITAIKAALEAKDEPVGEVLNERGEVDYISYVPPVGTALYTTPPKQEAKDEPWEKFCDSNCVWTDHHPDCKLAKDEPVAWAHYTTFNNLNTFEKNRFTATLSKKETNACCVPLYTTPQRKPPQFPTMLRKMWSGSEVQDWIKENWNKGEA
jgi:hypothetical protein